MLRYILALFFTLSLQTTSFAKECSSEISNITAVSEECPEDSGYLTGYELASRVLASWMVLPAFIANEIATQKLASVLFNYGFSIQKLFLGENGQYPGIFYEPIMRKMRLSLYDVGLFNLKLCKLLIKDGNDLDVYAVYYGPIMEELVVRFFLQEIALKRLPRAVCNTMGWQGCVEFIESPLSGTLRILFSAYFFSALHTNYKDSPVLLNRIFITGIMYGILQETTGNPLYSTIWHIAHNGFSHWLVR